MSNAGLSSFPKFYICKLTIITKLEDSHNFMF